MDLEFVNSVKQVVPLYFGEGPDRKRLGTAEVEITREGMIASFETHSFDPKIEELLQTATGIPLSLSIWAPPAVPATDGKLVDNREPNCIQQWAGCASGEYDPRCCRFPKSCSAGTISLEQGEQ